LIDGETGIRDDASKRTLADLSMIRHNNTAMRIVTAYDHVACGLSAKFDR